MKILVTCTLMAREWNRVKESLCTSVANFDKIFKDDLQLLLILQGDWTKGEIEFLFPGSFLKYVSHSQVSHSRNMGIHFAKENKLDLIYFHDSSIVVSLEFCEFVKTQSSTNAPLAGMPAWSMDSHKGVKNNFIRKKIRLIPMGYIWMYVFPVKLLRELSFNGRIGPGSNEKVISGEDIEFLLRLWNKWGIESLLQTEAKIYHPPRQDNEKQKLYAYGQGALYRMLFHESLLKYGVLRSFILFWTNSFFGVLILRPAAWYVLKERLKGFFSFSFKLFGSGK